MLMNIEEIKNESKNKKREFQSMKQVRPKKKKKEKASLENYEV